MSYMETEVRARKAQGVSNSDIAANIGIDEARVERCLLGEHVVRVVISCEVNLLEFTSCLSGGSILQLHRQSDGSICFDVWSPKDQPSKEWATKIAEELVHRDFNAVVAPRWADGS